MAANLKITLGGKIILGTSLAVEWVRHHAPNAGDLGLGSRWLLLEGVFREREREIAAPGSLL